MALRGTAAVIWRALDQPITIADLVRELADVYGAAPEVVEADVEGLVDGLARIEAVQVFADADH